MVSPRLFSQMDKGEKMEKGKLIVLEDRVPKLQEQRKQKQIDGLFCIYHFFHPYFIYCIFSIFSE